jgi:6-phosphogluconolactonase
MALTLQRHADPSEMAVAVSGALAEACAQARESGRVPLLCLAGGGTPLPAYTALAERLGDLPAQVVPGDERCIPHDHPACNLKALRAAFASAPGVDCLPLSAPDGDPTPSLHEARGLLASLPVFDATLLGMGADAHFASLFPHSPGLPDGLDMASTDDAIALLPAALPAEAPFTRITLTLQRLLRSRRTLIAIRGQAKLDVLQSAAAPGIDPLACPVAALLRAAPTLHVHWSP